MLPSVPRSKRTAALANSRFRQSLAVHSFTFCACVARPGRAAGPYWRRRARAPPRTGRLESVAQPHSRMKSPRQDPLAFCLSISSTHQRFSVFLRGSQIFSREKTVAPARKNTNAATTKTPVPALKKHQCLHSKTPMPRPQKHQCLGAKTPLPAHPMWPRPSAYTREFPKLTCVGTGPRPSEHFGPAWPQNIRPVPGSPIVPDAVGRRSFSLSSYGFVSVPARNAPACTGFLPTRPGVPLCSLFGSLVLVGPDSRSGFRRTRSR